MLSYRDFTRYFGSNLLDKDFQSFLSKTFSDLTEYKTLESGYIISEKNGVELGFNKSESVNDDIDNTVFANIEPIFSHFNIYPKSVNLVSILPFEINFNDTRPIILAKAGEPTQTKEGYADLLKSSFLIDNYKVDETIITFDYDSRDETLKFIQIRDNNLVDHLKM